MSEKNFVIYKNYDFLIGCLLKQRLYLSPDVYFEKGSIVDEQMVEIARKNFCLTRLMASI